jgi:ubiquinone/menaquinone biosynthesis C-methylase UbiE/uncharacterized protein YbaR (Trm112 family)
MKIEFLNMLQNPYTGERMRLERRHFPEGDSNILVGEQSGQVFPVLEGIPSFLGSERLPLRNLYYRWFYDRVAFAYDRVVELGARLGIGTEEKIRKEIIANLRLETGDKVLETAVGSARNFRQISQRATCFGLDISLNMLRKARSNLEQWGRHAELFHGDAEKLPFQDNVFDLVFQMGGLQFMSNPRAAIWELTRTAKPGVPVMILDEHSSVESVLRRVSGMKKELRKSKSPVMLLQNLVPENTQQIQVEILPSGEYYMLSFLSR